MKFGQFLCGAFLALCFIDVCTVNAISVSEQSDSTTLINSIVGSGIEVDTSTVNFTCSSGMSGTFSGGSSEIELSSGIVLSSGCVNNIAQTNTNDKFLKSDNTVGSVGTGQSSCDKGGAWDICHLQFDFRTQSDFGNAYFKFVFASEEYNEYVGEDSPDEFHIYIDDVDHGYITGTETRATLNSINNGIWGLGVDNVSNSDMFVNNAWMWDSGSGSAVAPSKSIEFNGFTRPLIFTKNNLGTSYHTMKIQIKDMGGNERDSALFIEAGSFSSTVTPLIDHIYPTSGGAGTKVTVFGAGFLPQYDYTCQFNGKDAIRMWRQNDKRLLCEASTNDLGSTVDVTVTYRELSQAVNDAVSPQIMRSTPTFSYSKEVSLGGSLLTSNTESVVKAGGSTLTLILSGLKWVSGTTFDNVRQDIIDNLQASSSPDHGWNNVVKPLITTSSVVRTSDTVVTITLPSAPFYNITSDETINCNIPFWANDENFVIAANQDLTIVGEATATIAGNLVTSYSHETSLSDAEKSIQLEIILDGTTWVGGTDSTSYQFDDVRQSIIDGIESQASESKGWNVQIRNQLYVEDVVRTSDTVVTINLRLTGKYHIGSDETVGIKIPAESIEQSQAVEIADVIVITNIDTFWEVFGVAIISTSITIAVGCSCLCCCTFLSCCMYYRIMKNRKKKEVIATHKIAEKMAKENESSLENVDRGINIVINPVHGKEGGEVRDRSVSRETVKGRIESRRVSQMEKGGPRYGVLDEVPETPGTPGQFGMWKG